MSTGADQTVCFGDNVTLSGSGASTYTWDNGITDNTAFTASTTTTYGNRNGRKRMSKHGSSNGNGEYATYSNAGSDQTVCFGDDVTLSGSGASI